MTDGGLTVSERLRRIDGQLSEVLTLAHELDSRDRADLRRFESHERRIATLESWQTWASKTAIGALITGGIGLFGGAGALVYLVGRI